MSLLFNMLSMLVIVFLPRSKRLLISWLQQTPKQMPAASPAVWPWMSHSAHNNIPAANQFQSWTPFPALQPLTPDHACLHYSPSVSFILIARAYLLIGGAWLVRPWVVTILCLPRSFCSSHFPVQKPCPRTDSYPCFRGNFRSNSCVSPYSKIPAGGTAALSFCNILFPLLFWLASTSGSLRWSSLTATSCLRLPSHSCLLSMWLMLFLLVPF